MGDPKKRRKSYTPPSHMWQGTRIEDESKLMKEYGLKNNREIWKAEANLRNFRIQARYLIGKTGADYEKRKNLLLGKLIRLGILDKSATLENILALELRDLLERRIQTIVYKKGIAKSPREARQLILHGHIMFKEKKHTSPSTLVNKKDETKIAYIGPNIESKSKKPKQLIKEETEKPTEEKDEAKKEAKRVEKPEEEVKE